MMFDTESGALVHIYGDSDTAYVATDVTHVLTREDQTGFVAKADASPMTYPLASMTMFNIFPKVAEAR